MPCDHHALSAGPYLYAGSRLAAEAPRQVLPARRRRRPGRRGLAATYPYLLPSQIPQSINI